MATAMKSVIAAAVLAFYFVPVEMNLRYKLCADNKCNLPISEVRALDNYEHQDPAFISFEKDSVLTIYGKEETNNPQGLWFGESSDEPGKRGFFVQSAVREETIFNQNPSVKVRIHIEDTKEETQLPDSPRLNETPESEHDGLGMSQPKIPDATNDVLIKGNTDAVTHTAATITETDTNRENVKTRVSDLQSASDIITHSASDTNAHSATDSTTLGDTNTQSTSELNTQSTSEPNTQILSDAHAQSESDTSVQRASDTDKRSDSELKTQSDSELNTQSASGPNTQSASELNTQSPLEPNTQSPSEPNTQSPSEPNTQSASEPNTQSPSEPNTQSPSEPNTESASELSTQSASEPDRQSASEPNIQRLSDTHTQSDTTIHYSTDIHIYDENDERNLHQEVLSDSEQNPQVKFAEEYTLVLEPVPHLETKTNPQQIDIVLSEIDMQTTEKDTHNGNILLHVAPHIEPEPETHLEADAKSEMLTNTGTNADLVEMGDSGSDNSQRRNYEKNTNIETDSASIADAGSPVNAPLNEIHSYTDAETSTQITDESLKESEQGQTSDDPENIHDLAGNSEHNIYAAKNSQTNLVSQNETNTIEESDLQSKNGEPTISDSFIHHHVSTEGAQLETNAIRSQTDIPTETGTTSDTHKYNAALEIESTEPDKENIKFHFEESSESETKSNMPYEKQPDYTNNVELVEETLPVHPQLVSVTENDYQERVFQSGDDPGEDIPLEVQSGLDLPDDEINENDAERDVTAPEEENEKEAPLSDEMKALMNHKVVPRKRRRHDITDEEDEENFLSGVFSAREHHIMHWERSKQMEESEETKKRKERTHRKGEKLDHEGSGMERAEAVQPLGSNNYSPRKVEIDMQLMEIQLITGSIPVEEKEKVRLRKIRKTRINIEYDLRQHQDEMRGEYLDEEEEELEEEEGNEKLEPDRNEYGRTVMSMDMSPSVEYAWDGVLVNYGMSQERTSSQEDEISTSNPHLSGVSSLDQKTAQPQEGGDFVGMPSGIVIDENRSLADETQQDDVNSEGEEIGNEDEDMAGSDQEGKLKGPRLSGRGKCYLHERHRWLLRYWLSTSNSSKNKCRIRTIRTIEKPLGRCHLQDYFKWMKFFSGSLAQNVCLAKKGSVAQVDIGSHGSKKKKHKMDSSEGFFQEEHPLWLFPNLDRDNVLKCRDSLYQAIEHKNNLTKKIEFTSKGKYGKCLLQEYHTWLSLSVRHPQSCSISRLSAAPRSKSGKCLLEDYHYWLNYPRRCPMMPDLSRKLPVQLSASDQEKCSVEDYHVWLRYRDILPFCTARQGSSPTGATLQIPHLLRIPRKCRLHRYFPFFSPIAKKISTSQMDSSGLKTENRFRRSPKCRAVGYLSVRSRYLSCKVRLMSEKHHLLGKPPKCTLHPYYPFFRQQATAEDSSMSKKCSLSEPNAGNHFRRFPKCRAVGYLPVQPRHLPCKVLTEIEKQPMNRQKSFGKCRLHQYYTPLLNTEAVCKAKIEDIAIQIEIGKQRLGKKCKADLNPFKIIQQQVCSIRFWKGSAATSRVKITNAKCRLHKRYPFLMQKKTNRCMEAEIHIIKSYRFLTKCWLPKYYPFVMRESTCKAKSITAMSEALKQKQSKRVSKCHLERANPFLSFLKAPTCRIRRSNIKMKVKKTEAKLGKCRAVGYLPVQPRHLSCKVLTENEKQALKNRTPFGKCRLHQHYPLLLFTKAVCKAKIEYTSVQIERDKQRSAKKCKADFNPFKILQQQVCSSNFVKMFAATPRVENTTAKCSLHKRYPFLIQKRQGQCMEAEMHIIQSKGLLTKCLLSKYYPFVMRESTCKAKSITAMSETLKQKQSKRISKCHLERANPFLSFHKAPICRIRRSNIKMEVKKTEAKLGKCRAVGYLPVQPRHLSCKVLPENEKQALKNRTPFGKCRLHQHYPLLLFTKAVCKAKIEYTSVQIERDKQRSAKKCKADFNPFKILQHQVCSARFVKMLAATPRVEKTTAKCSLHKRYPFLIQKRPSQCMEAEKHIIQSKGLLPQCLLSKYYPFVMRESICKAKSITKMSEALKQKQSKRVSKCHLDRANPFLSFHKAPTCRMRRSNFKMEVKKTEAKLGKCRAVGYLPVQPRHLSCKLLQEKCPMKKKMSFGKCRLHQHYPLLLIMDAVCKAKIEYTSIQIDRSKRRSAKKCKADLNPFKTLQHQVCSASFVKMFAATPRFENTTAKCSLHKRYPFLIQKRSSQSMESKVHIIQSKGLLPQCLLSKHYPFVMRESTCKAKSITAMSETLKQKQSKRVSKCHLERANPFLSFHKAPTCRIRRSNIKMKVKKTEAKLGKCRAVGYLPVQPRHLSCKVLTENEKQALKNRTPFGKCRLHQHHPLLLFTKAVKAKIEYTSVQIERDKQRSAKKCKADFNPLKILQQQVCSAYFVKMFAATSRVKNTNAKCSLHKRYPFLIQKRQGQCMEAEKHIIQSKGLLPQCLLSKYYPFVMRESTCKAKSITAMSETLKQKQSKRVSKCHLERAIPFVSFHKAPTCRMRRSSIKMKVKKPEAKLGKCRAVGYQPVQPKHLSCKVLQEKCPMKKKMSFGKCRLHQHYPLLLIKDAVCKAKIEYTSIQIDRSKRRSAKKCKADLNPFKTLQHQVCSARFVKMFAATPRVENTTAKCSLHERYPFLIQKRQGQCMEAEKHIIQSKGLLPQCLLSKYYPFVMRESICKAKSITAMSEALKQKQSKRVSKCHLERANPFLSFHKAPTCRIRRSNIKMKVKKTEAKLGKCRAVGYLPVQPRHLSCKVLTENEKQALKSRTPFGKCWLHQHHPLLLFTKAVCKAKIEYTSVQIERDKQRSAKKCKADFNPFKILQEQVCSAKSVKMFAATPRVENTTAKCSLHKRYPFLIQKRPSQCMEAEKHIIQSKGLLPQCLLSKYYPFVMRESICKAKSITKMSEALKQKQSKRVSKCHLERANPFLSFHKAPTCRIKRSNIKMKVKKTEAKLGKCRAVGYLPVQPRHLSCKVLPENEKQASRTPFGKCRLHQHYPLLLFTKAVCKAKIEYTSVQIERVRQQSAKKCKADLNPFKILQQQVCSARFVNICAETSRVKKTTAKCSLQKRYQFLIQKRPSQCMEAEKHIIKSKRLLTNCWLPKYYPFVMRESTCKAKSITAMSETVKQKQSKRDSKCHLDRANPFLSFHRAPTCRIRRSNIKMKVKKTEAKLGKCRAVGYLPVQPKHLSCKVLPEKWPMKRRISCRKCRLHQHYPLLLITDAVCKAKIEYTSIQIDRSKRRSSKKCKADLNPFKILQQQVCSIRFRKVAAATPRVKRAPAKCKIHEWYPFLVPMRQNQCMEAKMHIVKSKRFQAKCLLLKYYPFVMKEYMCKAKSSTAIPMILKQKRLKRASKCHLNWGYPFLLLQETATCRMERASIERRIKKTKEKPFKCRAIIAPFLPLKLPICIIKSPTGNNNTGKLSQCKLNVRYPFRKQMWQNLRGSQCMDNRINLELNRNKSSINLSKCRVTGRYPFLKGRTICKAKSSVDFDDIHTNYETPKGKIQQRARRCWAFERVPFMLINRTATCKIKKAVKTSKLKGAKKCRVCRVKSFPRLPVKQLVCKSGQLVLPAANIVKANSHKCRLHQHYSFLKKIQQSKPRQCMDNCTTIIQVLIYKNVTKKCRRPSHPFSAKESICKAIPLPDVVKESALFLTAKRAGRCVQHKSYPFIVEQPTDNCKTRKSEKPVLILPTGCNSKMERCKCKLQERYSFLIQVGSQLKARQCALDSKTKEQVIKSRNRKKCRRSKSYPFLVRELVCQSRSPTEGIRKPIQRQAAARTSKCWLHKIHPFIPFQNTAICKARRSCEVHPLLPDRNRDAKRKTPHCKVHNRYHFLKGKAPTCRVKKLVDILSADYLTAQFSVSSSKCQLHKAHPFLQHVESVCRPMLNRLPSSKIKRESKKFTQIRKCRLTKRFSIFGNKIGVCKPRMLRASLGWLGSKDSNGHGRYCRLGKLYPFMAKSIQPKLCRAKTLEPADSRAQVAALKTVKGKVSWNVFPHLVEQYSSISKTMCMVKGYGSPGVQNKDSSRISRATVRKTSSRRMPAFIQFVPKKMPVCLEKSDNVKDSEANQSTIVNSTGSSLKQKCLRYKPRFLQSVSKRMSQCLPRSGQRKQALDVQAHQSSAKVPSALQRRVSRDKLVSKDPIVMMLRGRVLIPTMNETHKTQCNKMESNSIWSTSATNYQLNSESKGHYPKCKARNFPKTFFSGSNLRMKCKPLHSNRSKPMINGPTSMELSTVSPPNLLSNPTMVPTQIAPSPAPTSLECNSVPFPFLNYNHFPPNDLCPQFDPSIDLGYSVEPLVEVFTQVSKGTAHNKAGIYGKTVGKEQTTQHNPVATDDDQIVFQRVGETVPEVNEHTNENTINHERLQAENEETDDQINAANSHSQEIGIDIEENKVDAIVEDESQNHIEERTNEDLKEDSSEEPDEQGASNSRELTQDDQYEADPDIQVIDGTTLHLSDLLPTPLSDEMHSQITPTPTPKAEPANNPEPNVNSQEMDLNPTRSTGQETPDVEQQEKWVVVQNNGNSLNHQHIEDQHSKLIREAENFLKTRNTDNMSPQMGKVVKDLMRKGILEGGLKEETPKQALKPSTETQDGVHKSDDVNLKDSVATDDSEIVLPSGPDLDSEKVNNFFKQLLTLPQFLNQPHKALQELNKYIDNPSTRVGLTKNEYQLKRQQEEEKLLKSQEKEQMGEEQINEDQGDHETVPKTPIEELQESDPEKLLRDGQQSHDDFVDGEAYLQAQEEEMKREKESQMKKGDEGDANQDVMQDDQRDTYASSAESIHEDVELFVDPARLLRESEHQGDQNSVEVEDGQLKMQDDQRDMYASSAESIQEDVEQFVDPARLLRESEHQGDQNNVEVEDGQDMLKDNQESGDQTDDLPEDIPPADSIPSGTADHIIDETLQSNLNGQPDLAVTIKQGSTAPSLDDLETGDLNGQPDLAVIIEQGSTAPSLDDLETGAASPQDSEPTGSQNVNLEMNDAAESFQEEVDRNEVEVTHPEKNELEKEASHQDPLLNIQGHEEMNVLTDEEVPHVDLTSSEHSRSEEMHQEIEELFAKLDPVDVPNPNYHESILDANEMPEESNEEPPEVSGPATTEDSYREEMHRMESTVHTPVDEQGKYENMYNTEETKEVLPDAGTAFEHSQVKDDEPLDPYAEEIVESTPTPPVASHVHVADTKDQQEDNNPSDTGRIFEGGNSEIHSEVEVEVEVEEEADGDIPSRFNRRQVPLGLDEGNAFSDPGLSAMNDTFDVDNWTMAGINMMKPVLVAINTSLQPIMQLLPDDVQIALHGADFLGIPWPILILIELISCAVFSFLLCVCLCSCRNPKAFNSSMLDEIEALHGQKADILDTLDMTTMQFKAQNRHYYEMKQNADKNQKERSKLSQSCKELKNKIQILEKELSLIKSTSGQNEKQLTATQQQVDLYEEQVSTASQTITALQQQVHDLEGTMHECATTIGVMKQEKQSLSEQNQLLTSTKEQQSEEISGWNERVSEMSEQVELLHNEKKDLEESVTYKDNEIEVLKDCLLQLKGLDADDDEQENDKEVKVQQLMDVTRVSAKLSLVEGEKTELEAKYKTEVKCRRELEAKVGAQQQEVDTANVNYKKAKSSLDEALTKLDVMTEYFKNKEVDLQRKLGREEALRLHSDSKLENAGEKAATAEVEVTNYRTQIKDLKEELVKAERNYRNQVAAHEKKAHDSWMSVRNAERELQEAKREAANLRHRLTELEGRRAKSEAAPLFKPSPSGHEGSPPPTKLGAPSRNSLLADTPSPPRLDQSRALSPGRPMYPGDLPPSPPLDNDLAPYHRSARSGRDSGPPPFPDDGPPPHMRRDMDYPPMGRLPPPGRHSRGPPMHDMDYEPHDMRDFGPDGPPPDFGFDLHGPPPPDMDFGPHGPSFNGPPPPLRHPFPPRDFPPHPDEFDHRGPLPDDRDFGPPRGYGPPPPGMNFGPMGPPPGGPMHGPGPFPNDMGPPPMDRREPPPPIARPGPSPGPRNPGIRPNIRGPFMPQTGPSPSGNFPPSGPSFGTPTGPQRRTSTPLEGTPVTPQTRPSSRPAQGP